MTTIGRTALAAVIPVAAFMTACGGGGNDMDADDAMTVDTVNISVDGVGLQTPESVLYDPVADEYLVSNINGAPTAVDGNGFISRIRPNGEVDNLKWIDGEAEGVTLNAPKGMALKGDTLFVADITAVRAFNRRTGRPLGSWEVPGSTFLNDLAVDEDGTLYVSDSGLNPDFSSSGTDAVYRFVEGRPEVVSKSSDLDSPNGLALNGDQLVIVGFAGSEVLSVPDMGGDVEPITDLPGGQLDGVILLGDGSMLVSSWETASVYRVPADPDGVIETVMANVPSPADIGWDSKRDRVLIPIFNEDRIVIHHIPMPD